MKDHSIRTHSILGPSSAKRWINCPGCIRAAWGLPNKSSIHADEGTAAHELGETCLRERKAARAFLGTKIIVGDHTFTVDEDFAWGVQMYVDTVLNDLEELPGADLEVEMEGSLSWLAPVDFSWLHGGEIPPELTEELSGSNDARITSIYDCLKVYDLKFGRGEVVEAKDNPQLKMYALAALGEDNLYDVEYVEMVIVQPRAEHPDGPVRRWSIGITELYGWAEDELLNAVIGAQDPEAELEAGDHCKFCKALPRCKKAMEKAHTEAVEVFKPQKVHPRDLPKPELMTVEQISKVMPALDFLEDWAKSVRAFVDAELRAGRSIPGYKLVAGSKRRSWAEGEEETVKRLKQHTTDLYLPGKFKSVAQIEKTLKAEGVKKKDRDAILADLVKNTQGMNVAPESSSKPAINIGERAAQAAAAAFSVIEE